MSAAPSQIEPNKDAMLLHLTHLFGESHADGLIEVAWTDPQNNHALSKARLFDITDFGDIPDFAAETNRQGSNIYIGAALRKPGTPQNKRANDADFCALTACYVDLDDKDAAEKAHEIYGGIGPTLVVITGQHPHCRAQLWWRLEEPETDPERARALHKHLARALGGDESVVNPSRVMRIGGSIAWPVKDGRVEEVTEAEVKHRPDVPYESLMGISVPQIPQPSASAPGLNLPEPSGLRAQSRLQKLGLTGEWHDNALRLIGRWVRFGLSDSEILLFANALMQDGFSLEETVTEMEIMIKGARKNWSIPDPAAPFGSDEDTPLTADFIDKLAPATLPVREWVLGHSLLKEHLSVLVAPPGVGKSTLGIAQAVAIITGKPVTGQIVHRRGKVWLYNNEDDAVELKRRLAAVLHHNKIAFSDICGKLALNSGADRPLIVAKALSDGSVVCMPDVEACIAHIQQHKISVFIVDPFIETHECEENNNQQIKRVAQMYRDIARRAKCAVLLVHHTAKPPQGSSEGHAGNMNTARGASALIGVSRVIETLFGMSRKDAERHGITEKERHLYVRLDDAKANLSLASAEARWFKRIGVTIANGDEVGVLEPVELDDTGPPTRTDEDLHHTIICALAAMVKEDSITVNAAATLLAFSGHHAFIPYRSGTAGKQKASTTFRNHIIAACQPTRVIVTGQDAVSFVVGDPNARPLKIYRTVRPAAPADIASAPPEFTDEMEEENAA